MATDIKQAEDQQTELTRAGRCYRPTVDIYETSDELAIVADMPGVKTDDVDIHFEDGILSIHGRTEPRHEDVRYLLEEYGVGDYYRTFRVGEQIDSGRISAEMADGVLRVHLPKAEAAKPHKIPVQAAH